MKIRKFLFSLSAVGMTFYLVLILLLHFVPHELENTILTTILATPIGREIYFGSFMWIVSATLILMLAGFLVKDANPIRPNHSRFFRYLTIVFATLSVLTCFVASLTGIRVSGSIWAPFGLRVMSLSSATIWLFMLAHNPNMGNVSRELRIGIIIGIVLLATPLFLQLVSALSYLINGHILCLGSGSFYSRVHYSVPAVLICWYCLEFNDNRLLYRMYQLNNTRNTHCIDGTFWQKSYPTMRIIAIVLMVIMLTLCHYFTLIGIYYHIYVIQSRVMLYILAYTTLSSIVFMWLLLTVMSFFQLPNQCGYKIFNWISLGMSVVCILMSLFMTKWMDNTLCGIVYVIVVIMFIVNVVINSLRVIFYQLPKQKTLRTSASSSTEECNNKLNL